VVGVVVSVVADAVDEGGVGDVVGVRDVDDDDCVVHSVDDGVVVVDVVFLCSWCCGY